MTPSGSTACRARTVSSTWTSMARTSRGPSWNEKNKRRRRLRRAAVRHGRLPGLLLFWRSVCSCGASGASCAEDYAPFAVDVTTEDPGFEGDRPSRRGRHAVRHGRAVSPDHVPPDPGPTHCGGEQPGLHEWVLRPLRGRAEAGRRGRTHQTHAYYQPAMVFAGAGASGRRRIWRTPRRTRSGHTFGLESRRCHRRDEHDAQYYVRSGPLGADHGRRARREQAAQPVGPAASTAHATNTEDDLAIIATHGAPLRTDDIPDSRSRHDRSAR